MRRSILSLVVSVTLAFPLVEPAFAGHRKVVAHHGPHHRTTVVVHRGFPIHRALPLVVVRPARRAVVVAPALFLPPVVWIGAPVALPPRDVIIWEDAETLTKDGDWTEFTLNVEDRGRRLFLEIDGQAQINFAEVVFENGDDQVVDFDAKTHPSGVYSLLDFKDGRKVDHVRMIARANSDEAKLVVRMEK